MIGGVNDVQWGYGKRSETSVWRDVGGSEPQATLGIVGGRWLNLGSL